MTTPRAARADPMDPAPPFLTRWALATLLGWAIHALLLAVTDAAPEVAAAPATLRRALFVQESVALAILGLLPALGARTIPRILLATLTAGILTGSWASYVATGRFAGVDTVLFLLVVPTQSLQHAAHIYPTLLPTTLLLGVALIAGMVVLLGPVAARLGRAPRFAAVALALLGTGWAASEADALAGRLARSSRSVEVYDPATGVSYRADRIWRAAERDRAGAAATLFRSVAARFRPEPTAPVADPAILAVRPPRYAGELAHLATPAHQWNVLVIEVESLRHDVLDGADTRDVMPTARRIAATARRYTDAYTTSTQTNLASVVPLTGQYPLRQRTVHAYPSRIPWPKVMLYDVLGGAGWRTGVFSSQNEQWWGMQHVLESDVLDTLFHAATWAGPTYLPEHDVGFARFVERSKASGKIDDAVTVREAIRWLGADRSRPFFLYVNLQTSHVPYAPPPGARRRVAGPPPSFPILFGRFPAESAAAVRREYHNALGYVDDQIAALRAALVADGRWDSTVIVITGDHGQAFYEHGVAGHANGLWQELVRVPLLIAAPALPAGDDDRPASHIDVAPTVAALLGLPAQPAWQGEDLTAAFSPTPRPMFLMVQSPLADERAVIYDRWKYVRDLDLGGGRLIDLRRDPLERTDLSAREPEVTARLHAMLETWRALQLDYYASPLISGTSFPPRIVRPVAGWMPSPNTP